MENETEISDDGLKALEDLIKQATPEPWELAAEARGKFTLKTPVSDIHVEFWPARWDMDERRANVHVMVSARNALPALLAEAAASRAREAAACVCNLSVPTEARQIVGIDQYVCAEHAFRGVFVLAGYVEKPSCCGACSELRAG